MSNIHDILKHNKGFVENKQYQTYSSTRFPTKKIAILSCMDTRLTELLPAALNVKNGEVKIIKNAGALITHPFGSVMRSLLVAVYELGVQEIMVIGHHDCGMQGIEVSKLLEKMSKRNISKETIKKVQQTGVDIHKWLKGFDNVETSVMETVSIIKEHPFMPEDVQVYGFLIDPKTGKLDALA